MKSTKIRKVLTSLILITMLALATDALAGEQFLCFKTSISDSGESVATENITDEDVQIKKPRIAVAAALKVIFGIVDIVGEIAGGVLDTMDNMGVEGALTELLGGVSEINGKLDLIQNQLNEIGQQISNMEVSMKLNTDRIINNSIQPQVHLQVSAINSTYEELAVALRTFNNKSQAEKETEFKNGTYRKMIQDTCTSARVSDLKRSISSLINLMNSNGSYTGALDAYTQVLVNRITIPAKGESYPSYTINDAHNYLSHYYADKIIVIYRGLAFIQNYYYSNNNKAEFFTYFELIRDNYLKKLSAKYLHAINTLVVSQANFRSVNDAAYRSLFMDVTRNGTVVYSKDIVEQIYKEADLIACVSSHMKYKGTATVRDDQGNTKQVDALVNRKVLGLFIRHFADPSRKLNGATITVGNDTPSISSPKFYVNMTGTPSHIDWQGDKKKGHYSLWKKENSINIALYNYMAEDMSATGSFNQSVNGVSAQATSGYTLTAYDMTTGDAATSATKEADKASLYYAYNFDYANRGYKGNSWGGGSALRAKVESNTWRGESALPFSSTLDTTKGQFQSTVHGRYTGLLMLGKFWEYHIYPYDEGGIYWKNIGDEVARLSVRDNYYFWMSTDRQMSKYWLTYELTYGAITAKADKVGKGPYDWDLNWILTKNRNKQGERPGLTKYVGKFDNQASAEYVYTVWPSIQVGKNEDAQIIMSCYQYLWTRWAVGGAEKLFTKLKYGSQTGKYELFVDFQESPNAWVGPINRTRDGSNSSYYTFKLNGKNKLYEPIEMPIDSSLEAITLGDFDEDYQTDLLLFDPTTKVLSYVAVNASEIAAYSEDEETGKSRRRKRNRRGVALTVDPVIKALTILDDGDELVDVGDYNGDFIDDLMVLDAEGNYRVLTIKGGIVFEEGEALTDLPTGQLLGSGDFNGDYIYDLLFYDSIEDKYVIRFTNSDGDISTYEIPEYYQAGDDFSLFTIDDSNADGIDDLIWRSDLSNEVFITTFSSEGVVDQVGAPEFKNDPWARGWILVNAADYNLDGKTDYLWAPKEESTKANKSKLFISYMDGFQRAKSKNARSGVVKLKFNPGDSFIK